MENLNAEQIIKALECCIVNDWNSTKCNECPIYNGGGSCIDELKEATIALITSQEQRIEAYRMELADARVALNDANNRLKECENGYEGTLFLDRCKLHDAEEKVRELTQAHEMLSESYDTLEKTKDELLAERSRLTEENERLKATRYMVHSDGRLEMIPTIESVKADTLQKTQDMLAMHFGTYTDEDVVKVSEVFKLLNKYTEEILEGNK